VLVLCKGAAAAAASERARARAPNAHDASEKHLDRQDQMYRDAVACGDVSQLGESPATDREEGAPTAATAAVGATN
jgi:hypothetical protein